MSGTDRKEQMLKELGLSSNEAKIYISLSHLGPCLVSGITKMTKINRSHVYERLTKLIQKGVASYVIQGGKKYFSAVPPRRLLEKLDETRKTLNAMMPELESMNNQVEDTKIEVFKGREGLKSGLSDILKNRKDVSILGFTGSVKKEVEFFYPHFQRKRINLGIKRRILAKKEVRKDEFQKEPLTELKYLPKSFASPSGMWMYGDKTVIFIPDSSLHIIMITSKSVAKLNKNH